MKIEMKTQSAERLRSMREDDPRIVLASNRLPVTMTHEDGALRLKRSNGGLVSGLRHLADMAPVRWYGWSGLAAESPIVQELPAPLPASLVSVPLNAREAEGFYRHYCNSLLWPLLHGMSENVACPPAAWQYYARVNARFALAILNDLRPSDRLWIHDYHLFLLPRLLRSGSGIPNPISFFLHTPFPKPDDFLRIPECATLFAGLLGSDVVGFHTAEYAEYFIETARILGYTVEDQTVVTDGRKTTIAVRPMGIDAESFVRLGSDPDVLTEVGLLRRTHKRILLGVDRLDYTKGIPQRMVAFEALLQQRPELRGEVSLLQIAVPTRQDVGAYDDLRRVVEGIVERVNRTYGTPAWTPIEYLYDTVDLNTLASLYRAADVMIVTPGRDGLNLVAKEFVATRVDGDGVLVLSKYAGVAKELTAALFVDPHRVMELAEALYRALTMPRSERQRRMRKLMVAVSANGIQRWACDFINPVPATT